MFVFLKFHLSVIVVLAMMINLACGALFGYCTADYQDTESGSSSKATISTTTAIDVLGYLAFLGLALGFRWLYKKNTKTLDFQAFCYVTRTNLYHRAL